MWWYPLQYLVFFSTLTTIRGGFFDFSEIDDPLAAFWNAKKTMLEDAKKKNGVCYASDPSLNGRPRSGLCQHPAYCVLKGGSPHGLCGVLDTCCLYKTCGHRTHEVESYFESNGQETGHCDYTIELANKNICQVRLDFEDFQLNPSIYEPTAQGSSEFTSSCRDSHLDIVPSTFGIPELCGDNTGQHVYVHVNASSMSSVKLIMKNLQQNNKWRIRITQLECPHANFIKNSIIKNRFELAPLGSIQYFTDIEGSVRSFGLKELGSGEGGLTSNTHYSISFKHYFDVCGIEFTNKYLHIKKDPTNKCKNYIFILARKSNLDTTTNPIYEVCGETTDYTTITFIPSGPIHIDVHLELPFEDKAKPQGFQWDYRLLKENCET